MSVRLGFVAVWLTMLTSATYAEEGPLRRTSAARAETSAGRGDVLYRLVEAYSDLGNHRTGTEVDAKTINWFAAELERRGGTVERQPFEFERFEGSSTVTIDGREVESVPLYYEGVGDVTSDRPFVAAVRVMEGHRVSPALAATIEQAQRAGATIAVVACVNPLGELQLPNRVPTLASGLPVVLVPGRAAEGLQSGRVTAAYSGKIVPGRSANVIATFGPRSGTPIVLSTPLSGWFRCAAERGTGIAATIALAAKLSARHEVLVVGASGHELLEHIGLQAYLRENQVTPALVVHLGANVALGVRNNASGQLEFAPGQSSVDLQQMPAALRIVTARIPAACREQVTAALQPAGLTPIFDPPQWHGEVALWAEAVRAPLLSFVGIGRQFHTPADVPEDVTSPELLETACRAIETAIERVVEAPSQAR